MESAKGLKKGQRAEINGTVYVILTASKADKYSRNAAGELLKVETPATVMNTETGAVEYIAH